MATSFPFSNAETVAGARGVLDTLALRYIGLITGELPRQFAGKRKDTQVNGRQTATTLDMELRETSLEEGLLSLTQISLSRKVQTPHIVTSLQLDRTSVDMINSVPDYHEYFVMGAQNNDLSLIDAVLSVRRAVSALRQQD